MRPDPLGLQDILDDRPLWEDLLRHRYPGATVAVVEAITSATHLDDDSALHVAKLVRWLSSPERERVVKIWPQLAKYLDEVLGDG